MKREIAEYVARCIVCQQEKPERQRPTGLLNHSLFLSGNGNTLQLISCLDCQEL